MRVAPKTGGGDPLPTLLVRIAIVFGAVIIVPLFVREVTGGLEAQQPQATRQQKPLTADELKTLQQRAEQGDAKAQIGLGFCYLSGRGVARDDAQAVAWFRKAAEQGDAEAQSRLSFTYLLGRGIAQDVIEAYKWASLAAARESGHAQEVLAATRDNFAYKMTPAQIAEAQKRASEWMAAFEKRKK